MHKDDVQMCSEDCATKEMLKSLNVVHKEGGAQYA